MHRFFCGKNFKEQLTRGSVNTQQKPKSWEALPQVSTGFPGFIDILHSWDEEEKEDFSLSYGIQQILICQVIAALWSYSCCFLLFPVAFLGQSKKMWAMYTMKNRHWGRKGQSLGSERVGQQVRDLCEAEGGTGTGILFPACCKKPQADMQPLCTSTGLPCPLFSFSQICLNMGSTGLFMNCP